MNNYELSIIIPFYNEEGTVRPLVNVLINEFKRNKINYELIMVDNGSSDKTSEIVDELTRNNSHVKSVHIKVNEGYGWGVLNGLKIANGEYIGYMDGDFEIRPEGAVKLYKKIKENNADIGKGIRNKNESDTLKSIASYGYDILFFLLFFKYIKQVNANPKIIRRTCYKKMNLTSKDWFIDSEIIIKGLKNDFKIVSQVVSYTPRNKGASHLKFFDLFPTIVTYLRHIIKARFS